jgi:hypothetical protein
LGACGVEAKALAASSEDGDQAGSATEHKRAALDAQARRAFCRLFPCTSARPCIPGGC